MLDQVTITIKNLNEDRINEDKINKDKINKDKINEDRISDDYINENQKLVENQEEILKNSNIEENIKIPLNENHAKTLHDNSKSNENKAIINRNNDIDFAGDADFKEIHIFLYQEIVQSHGDQLLRKIQPYQPQKPEYSSLIECTKQAIWIRRLVNEIFNKNIGYNIRIDNKPCKDIAENENQKGTMKNIWIQNTNMFKMKL